MTTPRGAMRVNQTPVQYYSYSLPLWNCESEFIYIYNILIYIIYINKNSDTTFSGKINCYTVRSYAFVYDYCCFFKMMFTSVVTSLTSTAPSPFTSPLRSSLEPVSIS